MCTDSPLPHRGLLYSASWLLDLASSVCIPIALVFGTCHVKSTSSSRGKRSNANNRHEQRNIVAKMTFRFFICELLLPEHNVSASASRQCQKTHKTISNKRWVGENLPVSGVQNTFQMFLLAFVCSFRLKVVFFRRLFCSFPKFFFFSVCVVFFFYPLSTAAALFVAKNMRSIRFWRFPHQQIFIVWRRAELWGIKGYSKTKSLALFVFHVLVRLLDGYNCWPSINYFASHGVLVDWNPVDSQFQYFSYYFEHHRRHCFDLIAEELSETFSHSSSRWYFTWTWIVQIYS